MSLDYPDYERIKAQSRWLGRVWMLGDCAYYLGLLGGILAISWSLSATAVGIPCRLLGCANEGTERYLQLVPKMLAGFPVCVLI
jgi:hypothetical protein